MELVYGIVLGGVNVKHYEKREHIKIEKVIIDVNCDNCEKPIIKDRKPVHDTHFQVTTSHHRWGNDSIDSLEHYDFCSIACLTDHMNEYYEDGSDTDEYDISLTKYKK